MIDFKKLQKYKEELTFSADQRNVEAWEKTIRGNIVRADVSKMDGVKELIARFKDKIKKSNYVLLNDRKLSTEDRDKIFIRKDEQQYLITFFEGAEQAVKTAEEEIKNL